MSLEPDFGKLSAQGFSEAEIKQLIPPDFDAEFGQSLKIGLCIPRSCSAEDIDSALDSAMVTRFWLRNAATHCSVRKNFIQRYHHAPKEQKICLWVLVLLGSCTLSSGFLDCLSSYGSSRLNINLGIIQNIFSPQKTLQEFFAPAHKARWTFLDHLRLRNHLIVIITHIVMWPGNLKWLFLMANFKKLQELSQSFLIQPILNNFHSEKTIMIGAVSSTIAAWKKLSNNNSPTTCLWLLVDRFLRFQGIFMALILIRIVLPLFGQGPFYEYYSQEKSKVCTNNFWYSMLHITNFIPVNPEDICLPHMWTFSAEIQLFVPAIVIIFLVKRGLRVENFFFLHTIILLLGYTISVFYTESLIPIGLIYPLKNRQVYHYLLKFYTRMSTHAWSYALAVLTTLLIINKFDKNFEAMKIKRIYKILIMVTFGALFNSYLFTFVEPTPIVSSVYIGIHLILFAFLVVFALLSQANECRACFQTEYGLDEEHSTDERIKNRQILDQNFNKIEKFDTIPWFDVALKSTRNAYYVHDLVIVWILARRREPIDYSSVDYMYMAMIIISLSYIVGLFFQFFVVSPSERVHGKIMRLISRKVPIFHQ
ncbi:uncharacterized protein LOC141852159 [Brevipalpus obovatus]|uniref:uncharacterized protein LOC141852159 n=1 Tax=Brevipalpus obovatus TaxID=246614 RepID=UPI003D9DFC2E